MDVAFVRQIPAELTSSMNAADAQGVSAAIAAVLGQPMTYRLDSQLPLANGRKPATDAATFSAANQSAVVDNFIALKNALRPIRMGVDVRHGLLAFIMHHFDFGYLQQGVTAPFFPSLVNIISILGSSYTSHGAVSPDPSWEECHHYVDIPIGDVISFFLYMSSELGRGINMGTIYGGITDRLRLDLVRSYQTGGLYTQLCQLRLLNEVYALFDACNQLPVPVAPFADLIVCRDIRFDVANAISRDFYGTTLDEIIAGYTSHNRAYQLLRPSIQRTRWLRIFIRNNPVVNLNRRTDAMLVAGYTFEYVICTAAHLTPVLINDRTYIIVNEDETPTVQFAPQTTYYDSFEGFLFNEAVTRGPVLIEQPAQLSLAMLDTRQITNDDSVSLLMEPYAGITFSKQMLSVTGNQAPMRTVASHAVAVYFEDNFPIQSVIRLMQRLRVVASNKLFCVPRQTMLQFRESCDPVAYFHTNFTTRLQVPLNAQIDSSPEVSSRYLHAADVVSATMSSFE
jgi:hypothetical protein